VSPASAAAFGVLADAQRVAALRALAPDLTDLTGRAVNEALMALGQGTLLVDAGQPGASELAEKLAELRPNSALLVLADDLPAGMVRTLLKVRTSDVLSRKAGEVEILAALARLSGVETGNSGAAGAPVWAFMGSVGGAGATTLAIETACRLARERAGARVCLIDLNLGDGLVASYLDARAQLDLGVLQGEASRWDPMLLQAFTTRHASGVSLLATPRDAEAWAGVNPDSVLALLDLVCAHHEHVVIDMPRWRLPWSRPILEGVDEVIMVSELTVPSLLAGAQTAREVDEMRGAARPARFVLNRFMQNAQRGLGITRQEAEKAIQRPLDATVRSDWEAARAAVNLGRSVLDVKPGSPLVKDVADFVAQLAPVAAKAMQPARKR
jgi:pilus assembly protein CpaE